MGSVQNCRKEIADRYPIRWFKCKLKPPKNYSDYLEQFYNPPSQEHSLLQVGTILQLGVDLSENFS